MTQLVTGSAHHTALRTRPLPVTAPIPGVELVSKLTPGRLGPRWIARECVAGEPVVVHQLGRSPSDTYLESTLRRLSQLKQFNDRHLIRILEVGADADGQVWIVTEYCGNHDGQLTLGNLLASKGGRLAEPECRRAARHLLLGIDHAHSLGIADGSFSADQVIVDRHGSLKLDLFGAVRLVSLVGRPSSFAFRRDISSVGELMYEALTGVPMTMPRHLRLEGVSRRDRRAWMNWLRRVECSAFRTPLEALAALPG